MDKQQKDRMYALLLRLELWFAPLLILIPVLVSIFFLSEWYTQGVMLNTSRYDGELILGLIILVGNLVFDVFFIKSIRSLKKKRRVGEKPSK